MPDSDEPAAFYSGYRSLLYFIPILGYIINLVDYNRAYKGNPTKKLFTTLENTALYFAIGFIARQIFRIGSLWLFFQIASIMWLLVGIMEAAIIRKWGGQLSVLGWGKLKSVSMKEFSSFMIFMYSQTIAFTLIGFYVAGVLPF